MRSCVTLTEGRSLLRRVLANRPTSARKCLPNPCAVLTVRPPTTPESALEREIICPHCREPFLAGCVKDASSKRSSPWWWLSDQSSISSLAPTEGSGRKPPEAEPLADTWKPGDVILDLYEVREVFTSGGRGLVYRVRHRGWNMDLAVKCPRPEFFQSEQDKADFEREAETWVKLGLHPHLVACHYVRRLNGIPRVFAEYVAGGSLAEWIRSRNFTPAGRPAPGTHPRHRHSVRLGLAARSRAGLGASRREAGQRADDQRGAGQGHGLRHGAARGSSAELVLTNQQASILVSAGGLTPAFCSPEQIQGRPVSRKTDIWSWGVSLLHMFVGAAQWSAGYLAAGVLEDYRERGRSDADLPPMPPGAGRPSSAVLPRQPRRAAARHAGNCRRVTKALRPDDRPRLSPGEAPSRQGAGRRPQQSRPLACAT